jgi:hypothetical protein
MALYKYTACTFISLITSLDMKRNAPTTGMLHMKPGGSEYLGISSMRRSRQQARRGTTAWGCFDPRYEHACQENA